MLGDGASLGSLKKLLVERTEGNLFFLEECVRTLVETQALAGEPGSYHLIQDLPEIHVPARSLTLQQAIIDGCKLEDLLYF